MRKIELFADLFGRLLAALVITDLLENTRLSGRKAVRVRHAKLVLLLLYS